MEAADEDKNKQHKSSRVKGPYILGCTLGEGAFAKVKLATHIHTQEKVAIKILDKSLMLEDETDIIRVQKEINILKKLRHKNIIQLYEVMESKKNLYIVMEYCEEKELFDYILQKKRLDEVEACRFFQEMIDGVEYLHSQNIVHRDLKPENLLLDYKLTIKISDFGLSSIYKKDSLLSTPCGTPSYAPPEMLQGNRYNGELSDIWSCGIILYAMLCGYLPFSESKEDIICRKILTHDYEFPSFLSNLAVDLLNNILNVDLSVRFNFKKIRNHPWFNIITPVIRPGIIIGYYKIPIDEEILELVEEYGYNKEKCRANLNANKYDQMTCIYYLCLRRSVKRGISSVSDLFSEKYLNYIVNPSNVIDTAAMVSVQEVKEENNRKSVDSNNTDNDNIKVNLNLNLNVQVNTTNNINIKKEDPASTNTKNINKLKNLKAKLKDFSSSVVTPSVSKDVTKNNNKIQPIKDNNNINNSNKNSFLANKNKIIRKKDTGVIQPPKQTSQPPSTKSSIINEIKKHRDKERKSDTIIEQSPSSIVLYNSDNVTSDQETFHRPKNNMFSFIETPKVQKTEPDDDEEDDFNKFEINSNMNVLEFIAKKLLGDNISINISKNPSKRKTQKSGNTSFNINNTSSTNNRSSSHRAKIEMKKEIEKKKDKAGSADNEFTNVINILNKKYKTFFESQKCEIDEKLIQQQHGKVINTLKKDKVNRLNKNFKKTFKLEEHDRIRKKNKYLNISSNYDPGLDSRNETSVERSISRSIVRNVSFSPEDKHKLKKKDSNNVSYNTSNGLNLPKSKISNIGIISEDDEFNMANKGQSSPKVKEVLTPRKQEKPILRKKEIKKNIVTINLDKEFSSEPVTVTTSSFLSNKLKKNFKIDDNRNIISPLKQYNQKFLSSKNNPIVKKVSDTYIDDKIETKKIEKVIVNEPCEPSHTANNLALENNKKHRKTSSAVDLNSISKEFKPFFHHVRGKSLEYSEFMKENSIKNVIAKDGSFNSIANYSERMNERSTKFQKCLSYRLDKNVQMEQIKLYTGPIDVFCIHKEEPICILETYSEILTKKKVSFVRTNFYKLRCSKNGTSFDLEIFKLQDCNLYYIKFQLKQGEFISYRKLINSLFF